MITTIVVLIGAPLPPPGSYRRCQRHVTRLSGLLKPRAMFCVAKMMQRAAFQAMSGRSRLRLSDLPAACLFWNQIVTCCCPKRKKRGLNATTLLFSPVRDSVLLSHDLEQSQSVSRLDTEFDPCVLVVTVSDGEAVRIATLIGLPQTPMSSVPQPRNHQAELSFFPDR